MDTLTAGPAESPRDRLNRFLSGDHPSYARQRFIDGLIGRSNRSAGLIDYTPFGAGFNANEAGTHLGRGEFGQAALSALAAAPNALIGSAARIVGRGAKAVEEAAPSFRTNPMRIKDEHDDEVSRLITEAYQKAHESATGGGGKLMGPLPPNIIDRSDNVVQFPSKPAISPKRKTFGQAQPSQTPEAAPAPTSAGSAPARPSSNSGLVVARKMPDGTVRYGKPGDMHIDLIGDDELERKGVGFVGMDENDMGWAKPGGPFMSRAQAAAHIGQDAPLESSAYAVNNPPFEERAGNLTPARGRATIDDMATPSRRGFLKGAAGVGVVAAANPLLKGAKALLPEAAPAAAETIDPTAALIKQHLDAMQAHGEAAVAHQSAAEAEYTWEANMPEIKQAQAAAHEASMRANEATSVPHSEMQAEDNMIGIDETPEVKALREAAERAHDAEDLSSHVAGASEEEAPAYHDDAAEAHYDAIDAHRRALKSLGYDPELPDKSGSGPYILRDYDRGTTHRFPDFKSAKDYYTVHGGYGSGQWGDFTSETDHPITSYGRKRDLNAVIHHEDDAKEADETMGEMYTEEH